MLKTCAEKLYHLGFNSERKCVFSPHFAQNIGKCRYIFKLKDHATNPQFRGLPARSLVTILAEHGSEENIPPLDGKEAQLCALNQSLKRRSNVGPCTTT
jgi:hypothetical protein